MASLSLDALAERFAAPPVEARPWGFWFLNDDTPVDELLAQLDQFAAAGFGTICPCARVGLAEDSGYLTDAWWDLMRRIVAHCASLGLRVVLYDEASYPSGAANGAVVAENPEFASRCLVPARVEVDLAPGEVRYARPTLGRSLWNRRVATVVTTASGTHLVTPDAAGLVRLDAATLGPGRVRVESFFDCPSGGTIRGAHAWQDDGSPLAPAAADLLNPDAVASFLRLTHDAYAEHLGPWLGDTIVALFTDEPAPLGRDARPDGIAWTPGFEHDLVATAGVHVDEALRHLPELFIPGSTWHGHHERALADRMRRVWFDAQRAWCDEHGIALTGHPERPDEVAALGAFTWPGQDTVWRWVLPGETALHGPESAGPRTAAGAAILRGVPTPVVNEVCGAYGWGLTLDEVKWLLDWLAVRGTTDFLLHALFASVRGNRAFESEPDLGLHNAWWPHLPQVLAYAARLSTLNAALVERPRVAIVVEGDRAPADAVAPLHTHQVGFVHATEADVAEHAFEHVVRLPTPPGRWWEALPSSAPPVLSGSREDLRVRQGWFGDVEARLLVNEGEHPIDVGIEGTVWDPWTGRIHAGCGHWTLPRRGSVWVTAVAPSGRVTGPPLEWVPGASIELAGWASMPAAPDGDWTTDPAWETHVGTVAYRTTFDLAEPSDLGLDLGMVGDIAEVSVNGTIVAHLFWRPHRCTIPAGVTREGTNSLVVRVTNSSANRWEGALRPSGLIGPASLFRRA